MSELKVYAPYDYSHEPDRCPSLVYDKSEVDKLIAEKDKEILDLIEKVQKERAAKVDYKISANDLRTGLEKAYKEIRMLRRALWVTRTAMAKSEKDRWNAHVDCGNRRNRKDPAYVKTGKLLEVSEWRKLWTDNERKCRAKAEEYK